MEYGECGRAFAEKTLEFGNVIPALEGVGHTLKGLHNLVHSVNARVCLCVCVCMYVCMYLW